MDYSHLSTAVLSEALKLVEQKQALEIKLAKVNADLASLQHKAPQRLKPKPAKPQKSKPAKAKARDATPAPAKPGKIKDRVISLLKAAGSSGAAVADLAATLQLVPSNLHVWFSTTGKKNPSIQKVGRGRYAWKKSQDASKEKASAKSFEASPIPAPQPAEAAEQPAVAAEPAAVDPGTPEPAIDAPPAPEPAAASPNAGEQQEFPAAAEEAAAERRD